ncbi:BatA domain-containing protein [Rhodohalobacter halophilus]|uniref:BatA domain-containing protein n=1 Tax=Rhodohalobacter halophilus TaxID=1812810 RepID=UPI000A06E900|nr:BatA domain-containing protein [Rhodohalobacter halophilus]
MSFLNPLFLIALAAASIPLLIYWLNVRKPKKVRFSTLAFFDSLKETALKRLKFKRILLLLVRMAAILMLVFAAAKPFLPGGFGLSAINEPKAVAVLIDNSPSMSQIDRNGPFMDQAKEAAEQIVNMGKRGDRYLLNVTNGESINTPFLSPEAAASRIQRIESVNKGNFIYERLSDLIDRLNEAEEPNKWLYAITDAQISQLGQLIENEFEGSDNIRVHFISVGETQSANVGVESTQLEEAALTGGDELRLRVRVRNYGEERVTNRFLNFILEGELQSQQAIELEGGAQHEFQFSFPSDGQDFISAEIVIDGDELTFDDHYYAAIELPKVRKIVVVHDDGSSSGFQSYLLPMLEVMAEEQNRYEINFFTADEIGPDDFFDADAIVLDAVQNIPDYISQSVLDVVQDGAGALLIPAAEGDISTYNRILGSGSTGQYTNVSGSYGSFDVIDRMAAPSSGHPVLDTIFDVPQGEDIQLNVPEIFYMFSIEPGNGAGTFPLLETSNGQSLIQESRVGNGRIIYSAIGSNPGWSNFPVKPFFAPFFYRTVEYLSSGKGAKLNDFRLGEPLSILLDTPVESAEIEKGGETVLADVTRQFEGTRLTYNGKEWTPGFGKVLSDDRELLFSVNQNAMESDLKSLEYAELNELLGDKFEQVRVLEMHDDGEELITELESASLGREIWFWFIIAAIILLLTESVISRFYNIESDS